VTDLAGLLFATNPVFGFALPLFTFPLVNVAELVGLPPEDVGVIGVASGEKTETRDSLSTEAEAEPSLSRIKSEFIEEARNLDGFFVSGGGIASVFCFNGESEVFAFFGFLGERLGDPARLRCKANSPSSFRAAFTLLFPFTLLESSEAFPFSEAGYGDADLPGSTDIFFLTTAVLEVPLRFPFPAPMQDDKWGAYRLDAIGRLQFKHSK